MKNKSRLSMVSIGIIVFIVWLAVLAVISFWHSSSVRYEAPPEETVSVSSVILARVTGYNTVPEQTDSTPCIAASGDDICGRTDVVACPRAMELGTRVRIDGKVYECLDRTALKFDGRFDISCDKEMLCPYKITGTTSVDRS
jgi:hypothetical protein